MISIPDVVQSQILSSFLDGKSISTYFHVLLSNSSLQSGAFHLIRDALVDRYVNLAKSEHFEHNDEVRDVLDIIREDIRTCPVQLLETGRNAIDVEGQIGTSSADGCLVTKISEWCAIIDYFERMRARIGEWAGEFTIWCGELKAQSHGTIHQASISTVFWTVTAMDHFHDQLELNSHYLTHPAIHNESLVEMPFGKLDVTLTSDDTVFQRILYSLNSDAGSPRYSVLVPSHMEYEATIGFALNDFPSKRKNLVCYWDGDDNGDYEYSLSHLGQNAIRILSRLNNLV